MRRATRFRHGNPLGGELGGVDAWTAMPLALASWMAAMRTESFSSSALRRDGPRASRA